MSNIESSEKMAGDAAIQRHVVEAGIIRPAKATDKAYFNFVTTGYAVEHVDGNIHFYREREVLFHPKGEVRSLVTGRKPITAYCVYPSQRDLDWLADRGVDLSKRRNHSSVAFLYAAKHLAEAYEGDDATELRNAYNAFLEELVRAAKLERTDRQPWLPRARAFLDKNGLHGVSLDEVAKAVGIHPVHLAQEFKRHYGVTVGDYVKRMKLEEARRQLGLRQRPIAKVAKNLGYYDHAHFVKVFKGFTGITPTEFRTVMAPMADMLGTD